MKRNGFTLAEVLISIGVFAIGMIAVASLFPVGALLQKETADDILGEQSAASARATFQGMGLTYAPGDPNTDLGNHHAVAVSLYGLSTNEKELAWVTWAGDLDAAGSSFYHRFPLDSRSFPATEDNPDDRDHFAFFFVRDIAGAPASPSWQGMVLVVDRQEGQTYNDVAAGLTFGQPTENGTPYITVYGATGEWNNATTPGAISDPPSGNVYFHPNGVAVETFTFTEL